jgi:hypothetical protein
MMPAAATISGRCIHPGAELNAIMEKHSNGAGGTVLRVAAVNDEPAVIQLLLKAGARIDASGDVVIEAAQRGCNWVAKVLLQARL